MFSFGEFKADDQEKVLSALNKKVEEVYRSCIGDNEANIRYIIFIIHQYLLYCAATLQVATLERLAVNSNIFKSHT